MNLTHKNGITAETKVKVTYPDNTGRETTIGELDERFKDEGREWRNHFFASLEFSGKAYGKFAEYSLVCTARELTDAEEKEFQSQQDNI